MNTFDDTYHDLMRKIKSEGSYKDDRTGTGTYSLFGHQMRFDLKEGFPLLTTKKVLFKMLATELIWFIRGDTNIRFLLQYNNNIWNEWAFKNWVESAEYEGPDMTDFGRRALEDASFNETYKKEMTRFKNKILEDDAFAEKYGDLGNVYGKQWRHWQGPDGSFTDQLKNVVESIKKNPDSRRHIVTAWNPAEIDGMALPPCHAFFQFYVNDGKLSLQLYQRSGDVFLGVPFNIASYALLLELVARECGLEAHEFIHTLGDAHIYTNHMDAVNEQLARESFSPPKIKIKGNRSMFELEYEDFEVIDYESHPYIKAPIAV
ncbi:thymidylate synthase [Salinicoccus siamensis]|uniref:Thymidylate synthase n=1 Tax=Salinicoccus siamensis TaxID=381830 RepID=A0ABV5Z1A3_9STAP